MHKLLLVAVGMAWCCAFSARVLAVQSDFSDFWGAWGMQSSDGNSNEWQMNCAQDGSLLVLTPDRIYTRGATSVYKDYADCRVLNGSGGAELLIHAQCSSSEDDENVMLEYTILSAEVPLRIQRRGQVSTEYRKCR
jgi:hypothetical protein